MAQIELPSGLSVVTHLDKRIRQPIDYDKAIEAARVLQEQQERREIWQPRAEVSINTSDPIAITFFGDLHIGNIKTRYDILLDMIHKIKGSKNHFAAFGGDEVDNAFIFREGGNDDVLTYDMQGEVAAQAIRELDDNGKVIYFGTGNHNRFVQNWYNTYYNGLRAPLIGPNMGTCDLRVGDADYRMSYFHKISMGNSTMSPFLREQRALEYWFQDSDIVVGHHTHRKAIGQYNIGLDDNKKLRTLIEAGTMKPDEVFQREQGNVRISQFDYCGASVILFPNEKRVIPYYDFEQTRDGLNGYTGLRSVLTARAGNLLK